MKIFAVFSTLLFLFCLSGVVEASILTTFEGIENLEWLEFSYTIGMSREDVSSNFITQAKYNGYRYATRKETAALLASYYEYNLSEIDTGWRIATATAAFEFLEDFGITYTRKFVGTIQEYVADGLVEYDTIISSMFHYGADSEITELNLGFYGNVGLMSFQGFSEAGNLSHFYGTDATSIYANKVATEYASSSFASLLVRTSQGFSSPVPEPATFLLFGTGIGGLVLYRRRAKK